METPMTFWSKRPVVVAGGTGFIGTALVRRLVELGAQVTAAARKQSETYVLPSRWLEADFMNATDATKICEGQEVMFITAALDGNRAFKTSRASYILHHNTVIMMNLLEAARANGVRRIILLSSAEVYPAALEAERLCEDTPLSDLMPPDSSYALSKILAEEAGRALHSEYSTNVGVARCGNVYGPGDRSTGRRTRVVPQWIASALAGDDLELWSHRDSELSIIYISDLVDGLCRFAEAVDGFEIVNFAHRDPTSLYNLAQTIISVGGFDSQLIDRQGGGVATRRVLDTEVAGSRLEFSARTSLIEGIGRTIDCVRKK